MVKPRSSDEIAEMLRTGKVVDAAVRRAVRNAVEGRVTPVKRSKSSPAKRSRRRKAA